MSIFVDNDKLLLPETSKDYITKAYKVVKVNAKGKRQERLIKFTHTSLLNIDPKNNRLQNEKKLADIEEISSSLNSTEIQMRFTIENSDASKKHAKANLIKKKFKNDADRHFRRYICQSKEERDRIIQDIYEASFTHSLSLLPQDFRVTKVNQMGKHQERLFLLTCDSLLNINNSKIKSEISFAGIESSSLDQSDEKVVWLKFKVARFARAVLTR